MGELFISGRLEGVLEKDGGNGGDDRSRWAYSGLMLEKIHQGEERGRAVKKAKEFLPGRDGVY